MGVALENLVRRVKGKEFRVFVHPPHGMNAVLETAGLARAAQSGTLTWKLDIYERRA
jgi:hypothetical protein